MLYRNFGITIKKTLSSQKIKGHTTLCYTAALYNVTDELKLKIKKNSFESVLMRCMKLEPIIQIEVSQKDKDHYSILTHIYGI